MDSRPPRPLIHNPNHQSSSSSSASSSSSQPTVYQPPSSQQPPMQIPFADPFPQRRGPDPFMPNAQSQRRGSYGREHGDRTPLAAGWPPTSGASTAASQAQPPPHHYLPPQSSTASTAPTAPPQQPSLPSTQTSTAQAPFSYDSARRRSLGAHNGSDSRQLPGGFGRQMPPPSPSQQNQQPHGYAANRGPPPPPSFTAGRELPGLGSAPRSSTGFSISSILGAEPTTSQPPYSQPHYSPPVTTQSPNVSAMQPPSPRRGHSQSFGSHSQWRRPQTPERSAIAAGMRVPESLAHSTGTSPFGQSRASPEYSRSNAAYNQAQYPVAPPQMPRPSQASPDDPGRPATDRAPPRPNSQPSGYAPPPREDAGVPPAHHASNGAAPHEQRPLRDEPRPPVSSTYDNRNPSPSASRDRPVTVQPLSHSVYSPPQDLHRTYLQDGRPREGSPLRRDDFLAAFRPNHRDLLREPGEPPRSHPPAADPFRRQSEPQQPPNSVDGGHGRPLHSHPPERSYSGEYPRSSLYDQPRAPGEEMQRSRSFLGITDPSKRGRASPLPQAVQGAQAQLTGPGGDPSIKREFGAIFQGLGSGLGGHLPGSSTPSRQSPMPQRMSTADDTAPIVLSDNDGTMSRTGSRGPRRNKRIKDEDGKMEIDVHDGARGAKRTKLSHHHHLPHTHPHHHHTHNHAHAPDSDTPITQPQPQSAVNRFNPSLPYSTSSTPTAHHHHHHIHPTHHHHHTARPPATSQAATLRKPLIKVYSQSVLDSVKDLPRNHLGSELYNPKLETSPPSPASSVLSSSKGGFRSIYKPSRTFTERDLNCTFTIRIPRFYLVADERLRICTDRCLWGTDLYTDDSDPLAAAMHAGWIRAEWPADLDTAQLNLTPPPADTPDDGVAVADEMHAPPQPSDAAEPAGVLPPADLDLHVTILILPKLKRYAGSVRYGIASRSWPDNHDGLSYAIHKLRWVDEGAMRGCERSGRARREERRRRDREAKAVLRGLRSGRKGARFGVGTRNGNAGVGVVPVGEVAA